MCRLAPSITQSTNRFNNWMHRTIFYTVCDSWTAISYIIVKSKCELMEVLKQSEECMGWHGRWVKGS